MAAHSPPTYMRDKLPQGMSSNKLARDGRVRNTHSRLSTKSGEFGDVASRVGGAVGVGADAVEVRGRDVTADGDGVVRRGVVGGTSNRWQVQVTKS